MTWLWLILAIVGEVTGTLGLRASEGLTRKIWLPPILISYVSAFFFLGMALRTGVPIGVAYGVWTALGIVLIAALARVIWKDPITMRMAAGITLIIVGVLLVEMG
ncbi:multidrug efflux SMR transporter [Gordonia malaquae]|uniref:DMT family transporter n=1 Tax=Gordonia malaquae TaxID=410332 RepID=UPI003015BEE5